MIFFIKWGDMQSLLNKKFVNEPSSRSPFFYYEDEMSIRIYHSDKGMVLCSELLISELGDINSFKMEFLTDAIELVKPVKNENSLVIRQE